MISDNLKPGYRHLFWQRFVFERIASQAIVLGDLIKTMTLPLVLDYSHRKQKMIKMFPVCFEQLFLRPQLIKMDEKEQEFLLKVVQLFSRFGIKSMTMDDIARNLGMSKKTIYQFVSDKNELVFKAMKSIIDMEMAVARKLCDENENAIDMLFALSKDVARKYAQMHPSINYDMQKYHPDAWHIFQEFQTKFVTQCIQENIERGIQQKLYRDNLDPYLIANFYSSKLHMCSDGLTFPPDKYSFQTIHLEMMRYHIRGIASEKGLAYLKEKVKQENLNL